MNNLPILDLTVNRISNSKTKRHKDEFVFWKVNDRVGMQWKNELIPVSKIALF